jgi:hypothetical protein
MDQNPYASPQVPDEQRAASAWPHEAIVHVPRYKLYSPGHVAWATFLGTPIAGCVLLAMNYWRLGEPKSGRLAVVWGLVATTCLLAIAFVLPENFPSGILPAAYTFGMFGIAKSLQGDIVARHLNSGGSTASAWRATGVGLMCLGGVLALVFAVAIVLVVVKPDWFPE